MNFPFLYGVAPRSTSYGVYIFLNFFGLLECLVTFMTLIPVIKFRQQNFSNKDIDIVDS